MIDTPVIRLATPADAAAIAVLSRDEIEYGLGWSWHPVRVRHAIDDADTNVVVVGEPGAPIAFGIMEYRDEHAHLNLLAVHRDHRRRGLGRALLQWLEYVAVAAGVTRIVLEARWVNDGARCFYAELGYHERAIERRMYGGREPGVRLEKWLV